MKVKMNTKLRLVMEVITVLYLFLSASLKNSDFNIPLLLTLIWSVIWFLIFLQGKRLGGIKDELIISILSKINGIVVYFFIFAIGTFCVFLITPYNSFFISKVTIGIYLMLILLIATVIRLLLFIYYDKKGM